MHNVCKVVISIHAPTRGATRYTLRIVTMILHFNPRSHERSDEDSQKAIMQILNFNPRSHERSDYPFSCGCVPGKDFNPRSHERSDIANVHFLTSTPISIHAPTRGATGSTTPAAAPSTLFQSTLPREERPSWCRYFPLLRYFNPRSHERSDSNIAQKICLFLYNTDNKYIIR